MKIVVIGGTGLIGSKVVTLLKEQGHQAVAAARRRATASSAGGNEFAIRPDAFHHQSPADVSPAQAAVMSATQRPVREVALTAALPTDRPAWGSIPSWFVFSDEDLTIPVALHRFMAGSARRPHSAGHHSVKCPRVLAAGGTSRGLLDAYLRGPGPSETRSPALTSRLDQYPRTAWAASSPF